MGRAGHNPFTSYSSDLGTPSTVPAGPSVAITFQGVPFTLAPNAVEKSLSLCHSDYFKQGCGDGYWGQLLL